MNTKYKAFLGYDLGCEQYIWDYYQLFDTEMEAQSYINEMLSPTSDGEWDSAFIEKMEMD